MRRALLGGVAAGTLLLAGTVSASPSASQAVDRPTTTAVDFTPRPVVLDSTAGEALSGTVTLEEPPGWTFRTAAVLDIYCAEYQWRPTCPRWLSVRDTTKSGDVRTVSLAGTVPSRSSHDGTFVSDERWGLPVWLVYEDPTGSEHVLTPGTGVLVLRGMRVDISGPDAVRSGDPATIRGAVEIFRDGWVAWAPAPPHNDAPYSTMTLQGSGTGGWESIATGPLDESGEAALRLASVTETRDFRLEYVWWNPSGTIARRTVDSVSHRIEAREWGASATTPGVPRRVRGVAGNHRAWLHWRPPAADGGASVNRYQVRRGEITRLLPAGSRSVLFSRLVNGRRYQLAVRAHNRVGWGPWSPTVVVRPHR